MKKLKRMIRVAVFIYLAFALLYQMDWFKKFKHGFKHGMWYGNRYKFELLGLVKSKY